MPESQTRRPWAALFVLGTALVLLSAGNAAAQRDVFENVEITVTPPPMNQSTHGYAEYVFEVKNRGDKDRVVGLQLPGQEFGGPRVGGMRSISRTFRVGAGDTVVVTLMQPHYPDVAGDGLAVYLDGRKQENYLSVSPVRTHSDRPQNYRRGIFGSGFYFPSRGPGRSAPSLIYVSKNVSLGNFQGHGHFASHLRDLNFIQASRPISQWSSNWLAYTRYDGIVVSKEDLAPGSADNAIAALWQYVEVGGVLVVLGTDKPQLPAGWNRPSRNWATPSFQNPVQQNPRIGGGGRFGPAPHPPEPMFKEDFRPIVQAQINLGPPMPVYDVGYGLVIAMPNRDPNFWPHNWKQHVWEAWVESSVPWVGRWQSLSDYNEAFPVVDDVGLPLRGLFVLIVLFAILIGPVNLVVLARMNRRIWLLWTVPALSAFFCLLVLGYMLIAEGWSGHARVAGMTLLDENTLRAATIGRTGFYSPMTPGDGLRFSDVTEITPQGVEHTAFESPCTVVWHGGGEDTVGGQHLARGWVTARVPAHFLLRKCEVQRRERVTMTQEADGSVSIVNALGADISSIHLADAKGAIYRAEKVAAGERVTLSPAKDLEPVVARSVPRWREKFKDSDWNLAIKSLPSAPRAVLVPGSYLAVVEGSPFLEQGMRGARVRPSQSLVYGIMKR